MKQKRHFSTDTKPRIHWLPYLAPVLALISTGLCQGSSSSEGPRGAVVKVTLSTDKRVYKVGETVFVTYAISNVGSVPVYVPRQTTLTASPWGGFEVKVMPPLGATGIGEGSAVDPGLDYFHNLDRTRELEVRWLLLFPGQFYGETTELPYRPLTPGKYRLVAEHYCAALTAPEVRSLEQLKYRVLQGRRQSEPTFIRFVK